MRFGERLRDIRTQKDLSQKALGDLAGIPQNSIARYETAEQVPTLDNAFKICRALGIRCTIFESDDFSRIESNRGRGRPKKPPVAAKAAGFKSSRKRA